MADETSTKPQRIGVLVVHGIGEQKRFETAAALARSLAGTLAARDRPHGFSLIDRTRERTVEELALPSKDPRDSPFEIMVSCADASQAHIHIHEVWWADLGVSDGLIDQVQFWLWALGQWLARIDRVSHLGRGLSNTVDLMVGPQFDRRRPPEDYAPPHFIAWVRLRLFLWGVAAFLTFFSWNLVKLALSWISPYVGSPSLITEYVSHVRIYTQSPPVGGGSLIDVGQPWRATIRRRMIAELVAMAERGYDRWYLLGHSQGAVVAFNAAHETEWCLPNYLQREHVERLRGAALWTRSPFLPDPDSKPRPSEKLMMPRRPVWLEADEGIARKELFAKFRGLLTYGAPLDKFATLWPRIVSLNKQDDVFPSEAGWVNLWDAADPIGARLTAFSGKFAWPAKGPQNIFVRANPLFLYAHICYLKPEAASAGHDTNALMNEILPVAGISPGLVAAFLKIPGALDGQPLRRAFALAQSIVLAIALALGAGVLVLLVRGPADSLIETALGRFAAPLEKIGRAASWGCSGYGGAVAFAVTLAFAVVFALGLIRRYCERDDSAIRRRDLPNAAEPPPTPPPPAPASRDTAQETAASAPQS